ncbi:MAG: prepilin-type N-terminal cleavage/methylation domain-containing protein [Acidobacteria bacterium]|nr:prepilin-type N-terminal cleavage/methylation domain-containing protein [Acidobacteriota bacterium]
MIKEGRIRNQTGFTLTELLISVLILSIASAAAFSMLAEIQHTAGYQAEVQSVLNNTQIAMQVAARYIRQAGNDPLDSGVEGITIVSPEELRVRSDLTGSAGPGYPDKGDPDGDIEDSAENVTIRYNNRTRSLEVIPSGGAVQIIAGNISAVTFSYYDDAGGPASTGTEVRSIGISISGSGLQPDPRTHQVFGVQLHSEIRVPS